MQKTDIRNQNLNLLVVLDALLETRSVTGAAEKLHLSQPAVSRSLAQLREMFDDPLFVRTSHGMLATPRAEALTDPLLEALEAAAGLFSAETFDPSATDTVFRIATTDYGAIAALAPALERFMAEAPKAGMEVVPIAGDIFRELAAGRVDLALYADVEAPPSLWMRELFEENYVCLVRHDHPLMRNGAKQIALEDFIAWPHALVTVFGGRRGVVDRALEKLGLARQISLWIPYFSAAPLMIAETDAILTLPTKMARAFGSMPSLALLQPPVEVRGFAYRLYWHERTRRDPAFSWLRRLVADAVTGTQTPFPWPRSVGRRGNNR